MDDIRIVDAIPQDVFGIRNVQKVTWINTYPNSELGITRKDVESTFSKDGTEDGRKKIEEWKKRYSDLNQHRWVVKNKNEIIGFCMVGKEDDSNRIYAIYVIPSFQGKGLGKQLMEKALSWLEDDRDVCVNVASYNSQAINFYEKFGFVKTGRNVHSKGVESLPSGKIIPEIEMVRKTRWSILFKPGL